MKPTTRKRAGLLLTQWLPNLMNLPFTFLYQGVSNEQFAVYPEHYRPDMANHEVMTQIRFLHRFSTRQVGCEMIVDFAVPGQPAFLRCGITCMFQLDEKSWADRQSKTDGAVTIEKAILIHFAAFTAGTLRGVLHVRQQNSVVNAMLPPVNVVPLLNGIKKEGQVLRPVIK